MESKVVVKVEHDNDKLRVELNVSKRDDFNGSVAK
ncbi:hypothetical protein ACUXD1_002262 [Staphylococcus epidermidis]